MFRPERPPHRNLERASHDPYSRRNPAAAQWSQIVFDSLPQMWLLERSIRSEIQLFNQLQLTPSEIPVCMLAFWTENVAINFPNKSSRSNVRRRQCVGGSVAQWLGGSVAQWLGRLP